MSTNTSSQNMEIDIELYDALLRKQILFIFFISLVIAFDFLVYIHLSEVMSAAFFPPSDHPSIAWLQIGSVIGVAYLSRPLGALLIGRYGDTQGRRPAIRLSMIIIAFSSLLTVVLPTYTQAGLLSLVLFIIVRLMQGMAFGAHVPLSWVFMAEHARRQNLASYCSLAMAGLIAGNLLGSVVSYGLTSVYSTAEMTAFGWRISAVIGASLSIISLMLWKNLKETPTFLHSQDKQKTALSYLNILPIFANGRALWLGAMVSFLQASLIMIAVILLTKLIALNFVVDDNFNNYAGMTGLFFHLIGCLFYGLLADKLGTGKTLMLASIILIMQVLSLFNHLLNGGEHVLVFYALFGFCSGFVGLFPSILVQLFPTAVRATAVSVVYNCVSGILGVVLSLTLFYLTNLVSFAPALYVIFVCILSFMCGLHVHQLTTFGELNKNHISSKQHLENKSSL